MLSRSPGPWRPDPIAGKHDADIIVVGLSGRALAAAARRAGLRPVVVDLFGDADTRALAVETVRLDGVPGLGFDAGELIAALRPFAGLPLVLGSGFEGDPALIEAMARLCPLAGTSGEVVRRLKDPVTLAELSAEFGVPHPALFAGPAPDDSAALEKRIGGSGGAHIRPAVPGMPARPGHYLQQRIDGRSLSILFLASGQRGQRAQLLGFSEQWCAPALDAPFRYGGAAGPVEIAAETAAVIAFALGRIVARTGLIGLASADLILRPDSGWTLIEINPRPGATLDLFDHAPLPPLLRLHLDACAGHLPEIELPVASHALVHGSAVLYAPSPLVFELREPPRWIADRPHPGIRICEGAPVCTVFAEGSDMASVRQEIGRRTEWLLRRLTGRPARYQDNERAEEETAGSEVP